VRAQLRRIQVRKESNIPQLDLIRAKFLVYINGRPVELTRVEFNLLAFMCRKANTWLTTRDLLMNVWGYPGNVGDAALVRNHIRNIRRKVEVDADRPQILLSRHRRGYMIVAKITIDDTRPARFTKRPRITHKPDSNASNSL
jgi:DNA-binding response OmpR family regulator